MVNDNFKSTTCLESESSKTSGGCCSKRSGLEKKLIFISTVLVLAVIGLVVAVAIVSKSEKESDQGTTTTRDESTAPAISTTQKPTVCYDMECMDAATYLLRTMNMSANPCEDFHEFVCGRWVVDNPIPSDKGRYGVFDGLRDNLAKDCIDALEETSDNETARAILNAQAFYKSCLKTEIMDQAQSLKELRTSLNEVGVSTDFNTVLPGFNVYDAVSNICKSYGLNFILSFGVGPDVNDTVNNIISLDQPSSFGLGRSFLVNFNATNERVQAYKKYMSVALSKIGSTVDDALIKQILDFEVQMAQMTMDPVERRDASVWYKPMTIRELQDKTNGAARRIIFLRYVNNILKDTVPSVEEEEVVIAKAVDYFQNMTNFIENTNINVLNNYLVWRLVQSLGPSFSRELREDQFEFDKVNLGIQKTKKNEDRCFDLTNSFFGHAVGRLYIKKSKFKEESKSKVDDMVETLYGAFRELVKENDWMDPSTKEKSIEKLDKMAKMMAYPEWILDNEKLDSYYNISDLNETEFSSNFLSAMKFSVQSSLLKLRKQNNRTADWISAASIVNAFYSPTFNSITFPAGILQNPFYSDRLKVLNYGGIGYVIGHEITHGFDDSGRQYDGEGRLNNWWTNKTLEDYVIRKKCFIDQYSSITDPLSGKPLNGEKTIGENIADNGGIRESFKAYVASGREEIRLPGLGDFTDLQLFYISAGSIWCSQFTKEEMVNQIDQGVHSPGMYRAYIPLANDKGFAEAFNCQAGTAMNPGDKRCTIW